MNGHTNPVGHYKVVCPECRVIIEQCRCPLPYKPVRFQRCEACIRRGKETPEIDGKSKAAGND